MSVESNHWSSYWESGSITSLPQDFQDNYDGEIGAFWESQFESLNSNSIILDLCTGNGAIALLAQSFSLKFQKEFNVIGVDAATINTAAIVKNKPHLSELLNRVNFISNCRVEDIDLTSESVDLITSQYGIEYCDWKLVAERVFDLLKPNGEFAFISHAQSTDIRKTMCEEQRQYMFLNELKIFTLVNSYYNHKKSFGLTLKKLKSAETKLQLAQKSISSQLYASVLQFLQYILQLDKARMTTEKRQIVSFCEQHVFAYKRLEDILNVSEKISSVPNWYQVFESAGLSLIASGDVLQGGLHKAGVYYQFKKKDDR